LVGGIGIVLFWHGVWHGTDFLALVFGSVRDGVTSIDWAEGGDSLISFIVGSILLLSTGLFVSELLSGEALIAQRKKEEREIKKEASELPEIKEKLSRIEKEVTAVREDMKDDR
jgi:hypothetical protein